MTIDVYELDRDLPVSVLDAEEVLAPVRQAWRDEDRIVDLDDEYRDDS
jgi:hypothetical protein